MDAICTEIYRYVIARQKVCLFAVARDFKICEADARKYLDELLRKRLICHDHMLNKVRKGPVLIKFFHSPLLGRN